MEEGERKQTLLVEEGKKEEGRDLANFSPCTLESF